MALPDVLSGVTRVALLSKAYEYTFVTIHIAMRVLPAYRGLIVLIN